MNAIEKLEKWRGAIYREITELDGIIAELKDGFMELPKDADREYVHVGDWITGRRDAKAKVVAVTSDDVYWWEPDGAHWCHAFEVRHYHKPTVKDLLLEFADEYDSVSGYAPDENVVLAKFAAKLQLREVDA